MAGIHKLRGDLDNISSIEMDNSGVPLTQNSLRLSQELLRNKSNLNYPDQRRVSGQSAVAILDKYEQD